MMAAKRSNELVHLISRKHRINVHNNITVARVVATGVGGSGGNVCNVSAMGAGADIGVGSGCYSLSLSSKVGGIIAL